MEKVCGTINPLSAQFNRFNGYHLVHSKLRNIKCRVGSHGHEKLFLRQSRHKSYEFQEKNEFTRLLKLFGAPDSTGSKPVRPKPVILYTTFLPILRGLTIRFENIRYQDQTNEKLVLNENLILFVFFEVAAS